MKADIKLPALPESVPAIRAAVQAAMKEQMGALRGAIADGKLSGQVLHARSGRLRESVRDETGSDGDVVTGSVWTDLIYAPVHEFGAVIYPKHARLLRFEVDGEKVFARRVRIPARPYFYPTWDEWRGKIAEALRAAVAEGAAT